MSTDHLFPSFTFRGGMASIANISGNILYNASATPHEADRAAIMSDWVTVGEDIQKVLLQYGQRAEK